MKRTIFILILLFTTVVSSQVSEKEKIERACLNYIEGFYDGDTLKLKESLQPNLYKFGFFKDKDSENYRKVPNMTYDAAMQYATNVKAKNNFAKEEAPKEVTVLDIGNTIAAAKVVAWWGIDYI